MRNCAEAGKTDTAAAQNAARQIKIREDISTAFFVAQGLFDGAGILWRKSWQVERREAIRRRSEFGPSLARDCPKFVVALDVNDLLVGMREPYHRGTPNGDHGDAYGCHK